MRVAKTARWGEKTSSEKEKKKKGGRNLTQGKGTEKGGGVGRFWRPCRTQEKTKRSAEFSASGRKKKKDDRAFGGKGPR